MRTLLFSLMLMLAIGSCTGPAMDKEAAVVVSIDTATSATISRITIDR